MLIGEYTHNLDPKKRLSVPAKMRTVLGKGAVITRGLDACLFLFPVAQWRSLAEKLSALPISNADTRSFARLLLSGAMEVGFDSLGRILVPDYLKAYAGLDRQVVVAGMYTRLEIWDAARWAAYKQRIEKRSDDIAQKLGDLGVI
ncbi:MAG TPA: division/cell wall cluster transcriptional repressor MraZ [Candidatus Paceibacterota bacterium]|nr:division/cell wall cluster transcriptional repressor MraZ [Candidatus Paceibacterota bacterium]